MSDGQTDIEVLYLGRRILRDGGLADLIALNAQYPDYTEANAAAGLFKGGVRRTIGAVYEARGVVVDGKLDRLVTKSLRYKGTAALPFQLELEALDKRARSDVEAAKADKKARNDSVISKEVERLAQLVAKVNSFDSRQALTLAIKRQFEQRVYEIRRDGK